MNFTMEVKLMEVESVISNTINIITTKLNIELVNSNNIEDYYKYLNRVLNIVKKPQFVPRSWIDEKEDLEDRITTIKEEISRNELSYVRGDSFGDGMPRGQSNPDSEEQKHIRRLDLYEKLHTLEIRLKDVEHVINLINIDFDDDVKDQIKQFIELLLNEHHKDVLKQFYIYRKDYKTIARDTYIAEETAKDYRKRGFKTLGNILYNFCQKTD